MVWFEKGLWIKVKESEVQHVPRSVGRGNGISAFTDRSVSRSIQEQSISREAHDQFKENSQKRHRSRSPISLEYNKFIYQNGKLVLVY